MSESLNLFSVPLSLAIAVAAAIVTMSVNTKPRERVNMVKLLIDVVAFETLAVVVHDAFDYCLLAVKAVKIPGMPRRHPRHETVTYRQWVH